MGELGTGRAVFVRNVVEEASRADDGEEGDAAGGLQDALPARLCGWYWRGLCSRMSERRVKVKYKTSVTRGCDCASVEARRLGILV